VWYYLIPFESTGKDVLMAVRIFTDTLPFYVVLIVCVLALATPLHLLSPEHPHSNMDICFKGGQTGGCSEYSTMSKSIYSTMMMTVFAATDMEMFNSWENSTAAMFASTIGILVIGLVIVNNLIALMTQSYEKLYPEIDNAMLMQKAIMMRKITWLNDTRHWMMRNNTRQRRYLKEKKRLIYFIADDAGGTIESAAQWRGIVFSLKKEMAKRDPSQDVEELKTEVQKSFDIIIFGSSFTHSQSPIPPYTHRALCSTWSPGFSDADWRLQSDPTLCPIGADLGQRRPERFEEDPERSPRNRPRTKEDEPPVVLAPSLVGCWRRRCIRGRKGQRMSRRKLTEQVVKLESCRIKLIILNK